MGENSLRALASDLAYLEGWAAAATGDPLPWPSTEALALKFVAHHLWDPAQRENDPRHGRPAEIAEALRAEGLLRSDGPHAPSTVKRRLASWGTLHRWKGIEGPFSSPALRDRFALILEAEAARRARRSPCLPAPFRHWRRQARSERQKVGLARYRLHRWRWRKALAI
jgi:hypothetical protein